MIFSFPYLVCSDTCAYLDNSEANNTLLTAHTRTSTILHMITMRTGNITNVTNAKQSHPQFANTSRSATFTGCFCGRMACFIDDLLLGFNGYHHHKQIHAARPSEDTIHSISVCRAAAYLFIQLSFHLWPHAEKRTGTSVHRNHLLSHQLPMCWAINVHAYVVLPGHTDTRWRQERADALLSGIVCNRNLGPHRINSFHGHILDITLCALAKWCSNNICFVLGWIP